MKSLFHRISLNLFSSIICCCLFFSIASATGSDIIKEDILNAIEKKYAGKSFKADFTQISRLAALDITEKASGRASFSHPGKMKWQYLEPERHEIITNGKLLWIFRPQENQVMTGDASQFFKSGAGGAFLSDISLIRKNFSISVKEVAADYVEINLNTKRKNPDISSIVIRISQKNSEIIRVVTYNPYDDTTLFEFSNIQFKKINPDVFEFKVPDGVNIIKMD
ncbi:MAG: outer membrane lipoprotein carrier protein LolA [Desulfobacula sp.]|uniref:LolA family protein n=1 Tax=Desulfobacula sp. TaxID=2593537 RepID=UPI0025BD06D7|nr:outer membrane lipoprotein carrier protein LolA [Desulfobacula sp.]MCD4719235.1 outer membrane lipoprotein carrier protein LolA [Desulfobacula sp.]